MSKIQKVVICTGLPASGKSTWAKAFLAENPGWKRLNRDLFRENFDFAKWSPENEEYIVKARDIFLTIFLEAGHNVVIDDTNFGKNIADITEVVDRVKPCAEIEIKSFLDVPLEVCIARNQSRPNRVPEEVIKKMYRQHVAPAIEAKRHEYKPFVPGLPQVVVIDMDGTLATMKQINGNVRGPYDHETCDLDGINAPVATLADIIANHFLVLIVSGRERKFEPQTTTWLKNNHIKYEAIFMRETGDKRSDDIVKREIYEKEIEGKYNILFVLDDRDRVVKAWRDLGLACFQVCDGAF